MGEIAIDDATVRWAVRGNQVAVQGALSALATQPLLVLMHGFGSFEGDLIELASRLPHGFVCASPRAPLAAPPPVVNGYSWWPMPTDANGLPQPQTAPERFVGSGPHAAAQAVLAWLDRLDASLRASAATAAPAAGEHGAAEATGLGQIALLGFSQGGCLVTSMLRLRPHRFVCGVNCSGFVAPGSFADDAVLAAARPPLFWGRDRADPIIDQQRIELTARWSKQHTVLEAKHYPGMLHSIGDTELADIREFLLRQLSAAESRSITAL